MNKIKKIIRNIVIISALFLLFLKMSGLYLTPLSAHENSERSIHYGPSEVVHIANFNKGKYILSKYDKWISCNTVNRKLFLFWRFGNQSIGFENDKTKGISYNWGMSDGNWKLYGIINDDQISKIEITLQNGKVLEETEFYDDLFLFTWGDDDKNYYMSNIKGYDSYNNIIFQHEDGY